MNLDTDASVLGAHVASVTLVVHVCAGTNLTFNFSFEVLAVETKGLFLSSNIGGLCSHEALVLTVSAIKGRPKFEIRGAVACVVDALALGLVKISEVESHHNSRFVCIDVRVLQCVFFPDRRAVDHELL